MILVRLPKPVDKLNAVLPRSRPVTAEDLPLVTRVTDDLAAARSTAARLRAVGAQVVIVEEPIDQDDSAFCSAHPAQLAARSCDHCERAICPGCMADSGGDSLCETCRVARDQSAMKTRRRQLMAILIFVAFLYKVFGYLQADIETFAGHTPITIGIVQFAPKSSENANIIHQLNQRFSKERTGPSLTDLSVWFSDEYARYTGNKDKHFRIAIRGPFGVDLEPPSLSEEGDSWFTLMLRAYRYPRYFEQLASDNGVRVEDYAVKVYVIYGGNSLDMASHSRASKNGRVAVVYVSLDETNPSYALATVAHEIGHALGATDTYNPETSHAIHPQGYVEPFNDPLFPQRYAELMAVDIPLSRTVEQEVGSLSQIRIGHQTAAEFGWIPPEQATLFYTPAEVTPEQRLDISSASKVMTEPINETPQ